MSLHPRVIAVKGLLSGPTRHDLISLAEPQLRHEESVFPTFMGRVPGRTSRSVVLPAAERPTRTVHTLTQEIARLPLNAYIEVCPSSIPLFHFLILPSSLNSTLRPMNDRLHMFP